MKILVSNDDGVLAEGLWTLVKELRKAGRVVVVAPDREQSAIGTAVTLRQVLRVHKVRPLVPEVETHAVDGTPSDAVILALGKLVKDIDLVVSGINQGSNLGEDVHISGTVGAAMQGYLRGFPSVAVSAPYGKEELMQTAAEIVASLARKVIADGTSGNFFLNINIPDVPRQEIRGIKITRLANESHINTVEEAARGSQQYYWLVRQRAGSSVDDRTDIWAIEHGYVSITPLWLGRTDKSPLDALKRACPEILREIKSNS